ncbi:MAG: 4'-phosphopantetheinyl transferase superfamily protein [Chloroflexi bacterium]|nr:4'-phosphopantetheinyl transferase superfamily protein [Chloroflexota bacterium]
MSRTAPSYLPSLTGDAVHLWQVLLNATLYPPGKLQPLLAPGEMERAGRYYFQRDREAFILARGFLRLILGVYLDMAPHELHFGYAAYGKPFLVAGQGAADSALTFNISHSHGLMLLAVTLERQVGVDVEFIRTDFDSQELSARFFAAAECAFLRSLPPAAQAEAFFAIWTRKEAYIKARGEGLSCPLDSFDVTPPDRDWGRKILLQEKMGFKNGASTPVWLVQEVALESGYKAALASEGENCRLSLWRGVAEIFAHSSL